MINRQVAAVVLALAVTLPSCARDETAAKPAAKYEMQLVRRAGSSAADAKVYLVQNGRKRWVVNGSWIVAHGYAWPKDVHVIPAGDLDQIPTGEPITERS